MWHQFCSIVWNYNVSNLSPQERKDRRENHKRINYQNLFKIFHKSPETKYIILKVSASSASSGVSESYYHWQSFFN